MPLPRVSNKDLSSIIRHYVTIEERTETTDSEGGFTSSWSTVSGYSSVPAAIWPIFAFQKAHFRSIDTDATHYIIMRGEISITPKDNRITYDSRTFEILAVEDIQERGLKKQCSCRERVE